MRALITLLSLALAPSACVIHNHLGSNASGHVSLETPPSATPPTPKKSPPTPIDGTLDVSASTVERPADPGEQGVIAGGSLTGGYAFANFDGVRRGGGLVALELNVFRFSHPTSHSGWVTPHVLDGAMRLAVGGGLHIFSNTGEPTYVRAAPIYAEWQISKLDELFGGHLGLGAAFLPAPSSAGPQVSACVGMPLLFIVCGRGAYLFGSGADIGIALGYNGFAEWVGSR